ncbi:MAG: bacterial Ig-like domain-containing protein [Clostridia bacterium]|nr:bacterial Ig-like domain-containing protein [Clostridia bacterium]
MKPQTKVVAFLLVALLVLSLFGGNALPSFAEEADTYPHLTAVPEGYVGIYTIEDLSNVRNNLAGNYILMNDLEFKKEDFQEGGIYYIDGYRYAWPAIGSLAEPFSGIFDGNGYEIRNLVYNGDDGSDPYYAFGGLFASLSGTVQNLGVVDCSIRVSKKHAYAGAITANVQGNSLIKNCYASGGVSASGLDSVVAGGLAAGGGTIEDSYNLCHVSATGKLGTAGGIAGTGSQISRCYNTGNVSGGYSAGGICGNGGNITDCFNTGIITRGEKSGGIVGSASGVVTNCYNVGCIKDGYKKYVGIVGKFRNEGKQVNCYMFDKQASGEGLGARRSEEQMRTQETFKDFDFTNVWTMGGSEDYPYPELKALKMVYAPKAEYLSLSTRPKDVYEIGDAFDPSAGVFRIDYTNGTYKLFPLTGEMVTGFDSSKVGEVLLTVTYEEFTETFSVSIQEKTVPESTQSDTEASSDTTPSDTDAPVEPIEESSGLWIVVVVLVVAALGGAAAFFVIKAKKKK